MASDANDYHIYHINQDGKLVGKFKHTDDKATCLIDSINIAQGMLKREEVKSALIQIATEFCEVFPTAWFLLQEQGTQEEKIDNLVRQFLDMFLIPEFPTLYISDRLKHLDVTGVTHRFKWEDHFSMSSQRIALNGNVSRKPA